MLDGLVDIPGGQVMPPQLNLQVDMIGIDLARLHKKLHGLLVAERPAGQQISHGIVQFIAVGVLFQGLFEQGQGAGGVAVDLGRAGLA